MSPGLFELSHNKQTAMMSAQLLGDLGPALSTAAAASICASVHLLCHAQAGWEGCNLLQTSWQGSVHSKRTNTDAGTNGVGCLDERAHIWDLFPSQICLETHHTWQTALLRLSMRLKGWLEMIWGLHGCCASSVPSLGQRTCVRDWA